MPLVVWRHRPVHVNRGLTTIIAWACVILISALKVFRIYRSIFGKGG